MADQMTPAEMRGKAHALRLAARPKPHADQTFPPDLELIAFREQVLAGADALDRLADMEEKEPNLSMTEGKSAVRWEYGIERDQVTAMGTRKRAEAEIERQRKPRARGFRITGQKLVRRLVSDWEEAPNVS